MKHLIVCLFTLFALLPATAQNSPARHIEKAVKELEKTVKNGDVVIRRDPKTKKVAVLTKHYRLLSTEGKTFHKLWNAFLADAPEATSEMRKNNRITLVFNEKKETWTYILEGSGRDSNITVDLRIFYNASGQYADAGSQSALPWSEQAYADTPLADWPPMADLSLPDGCLEHLDSLGGTDWKARLRSLEGLEERLKGLEQPKGLEQLEQLKQLKQLEQLMQLEHIDWADSLQPLGDAAALETPPHTARKARR